MKASPHRESTLLFYKAGMRRVLERIQEHLDGPHALGELAALASLSPFHFYRVFRGMLGEPLAAYIRRLRLERAALHLQGSRRRVIEVALNAGYDSHEAFSRAFRLAYGQSPSRFRRDPGASFVLPAPSGVHYCPGSRLKDFRTLNASATNMTIAIVNFPARRVAFVRHRGAYQNCGTAWDRLCTWMGKEGYPGGQCEFIGVSYDDPETTAPENIRYDACLTIGDEFEGGEGIEVEWVGGGEYARTTHFGPYERLNETYGRVMGQWLPREGRILRDGPGLEIYLNAPGDTPPEELLTDLFVPVESFEPRTEHHE